MLNIAMRNSLLIGVLCASFAGVNCHTSARAQLAPAATQTAAANGYDLLMAARPLLLPGLNGEPSAAEKLALAENLRRQRLAVARNAPALAQVRAALKLGIAIQPQDGPNFQIGAAAREFARQFAQEAAVRAADGDAMGAAQSSLDSFELGAQIGRGSLIQSLVGTTIASIARVNLLKYAPLLSAEQSREVAAQWEQINATRPTFAQILRDEEQTSARFTKSMLFDPKSRAQLEAKSKKPPAKDAEFTLAQMRQLLALTSDQVEAEYAQVFDAAVLRAAQPYQSSLKAAPFHSDDPLVRYSADSLSNPLFRFGFERDVTLNRFAAAALQLRAIKLETGNYPETFDAGADPYSPDLAPLIYRREGENYLLYSVGPDGKDEGGAEIQTLVTDEKTGVKSVNARLMPDSTGDMMAPVL